MKIISFPSFETRSAGSDSRPAAPPVDLTPLKESLRTVEAELQALKATHRTTTDQTFADLAHALQTLAGRLTFLEQRAPTEPASATVDLEAHTTHLREDMRALIDGQNKTHGEELRGIGDTVRQSVETELEKLRTVTAHALASLTQESRTLGDRLASLEQRPTPDVSMAPSASDFEYRLTQVEERLKTMIDQRLHLALTQFAADGQRDRQPLLDRLQALEQKPAPVLDLEPRLTILRRECKEMIETHFSKAQERPKPETVASTPVVTEAPVPMHAKSLVDIPLDVLLESGDPKPSVWTRVRNYLDEPVFKKRDKAA